MSKNSVIPLLIYSVFFTSAYARADQQGFSDLSLKELVAMDVFTAASLVPTQVNKAPGTVYTFNRDDFKRYGVRRLEDLLQFVPGLQLNQYRKRHRAIWARGVLDRYNDKMILMVDGVRVRQLYYNHFSLGDNLPLEYLETVEVILGPASSLYGANAFAGIISVTTRNFSDTEQLEMGLEAGSNQRAKGTALYNSGKLQLFASHLDQDAPFRSERKSFIGGESLQPRDEDYSNIHIKAQPLPRLTLQLDYNRSETPFLFIPSTQDAYIDSDFLNLSAHYETGSIEEGQLETTFYYQKDNTREYELEQTTQSPGYEEYQNGIMAGASLTLLKQFQLHTLAGGISWNYEQAQRSDYRRSYHFSSGFLSPPETGNLLSEPGITNNDYVAFAQDIWQIHPDLSLTIGGRFDYFEQFGGYFNHREALVYTPDTQQTWKLQHGTAIRTPGFREYLKVLEGTSFQPPQVDAERITMSELGYLYQWDEASMNINLFNSQIDDFIQETPTPDDADEYFTNSNTVYRMRGAELLLTLRPMRKLNTRVGISYLETESDGESLPYLAAWTGSLQTDYQISNDHLLGASLIYSSRRTDTNSFDDGADSFATVNLFGSGKLTQALNYSFGIDNLFDKRVMDPAADFGKQYNNERSERELWLRLEWNHDLL
ncbi:Outer membrane receptor for ferrienterochelin and colicins [Amphritea atlantica]|uniref:Outer membrane receptor for ferrienterochelin and colicins n=1 Tax=Amphritea atlantica TaxID=355243 RepID=A0A1H9ECJ2_9GAMM|nr:TonB-dependent receptor [Amphritea atlantica]SEQ23420.1 Outer membrane receptor for ferrienterochelin and colicins [Amphritea atlantica]